MNSFENVNAVFYNFAFAVLGTLNLETLRRKTPTFDIKKSHIIIFQSFVFSIIPFHCSMVLDWSEAAIGGVL